MDRESLHDGSADGLKPLESLDLDQVGSFADLLRAMSKTAFSGRQMGEAFEILLEMVRDEDCRVVLTISGAMTVAKQGKIICDMIDRGIVDAVVATGALIAHGLTESIGLTHYRYEPSMSDDELYAKGYNRIYDTLEMESNLDGIQLLVSSVLKSEQPEDGVWSSARICKALGKRLSEMDEGAGILRSAYEQDVPVFIPAFTDSEIGLDVSLWAMSRFFSEEGRDPASMEADALFRPIPPFNPFVDLQQYARFIAQSPRTGILTIGGGVPRNWAQQVAPYFEIVDHRLGAKTATTRFCYGIRICPEPVHWGGMSGCTYSEGVSWGKFMPTSEGGRYAEIHSDATVVLPLLARAVFEELDAQGDRG